MAGAIEAYLEARRQFHSISADVYDLGSELARIGEAMCDEPTEVNFDPKQWKSAQEIQGMLALYQEARNAMDTSWEQIPRDLRYGLLPPIGSDDSD
jgi:hypothetical protein